MVERIRTLLESRQLTPTQFADVIGVARPIVSHILSGRNKPSLEVVQRILAAMPDLAMPWLLNGSGPMLAGASADDVPSEASEAVIAPVALAPAPAPAYGTVDERHQTVAEAANGVPQPLAPIVKQAEPEVVKPTAPTAVPPRTNAPALGRPRIAPKRFVANTAPVDTPTQAPVITPTSTQSVVAAPELPPAAAPGPDDAPELPVSPPPPVEVPAAAVPLPPMPASSETSGAALASALFAGGDKPIRRIVIFYRDGSFADYQPE